MIAFDTNLLVRALVADHDDQVAVMLWTGTRRVQILPTRCIWLPVVPL
jgi:hypothetical protein